MPSQVWRSRKGTVVDVQLPLEQPGHAQDCEIGIPHRHCPCGCGSWTITEPTGLTVCKSCGKQCIRIVWLSSASWWVCQSCKKARNRSKYGSASPRGQYQRSVARRNGNSNARVPWIAY